MKWYIYLHNKDIFNHIYRCIYKIDNNAIIFTNKNICSLNNKIYYSKFLDEFNYKIDILIVYGDKFNNIPYDITYTFKVQLVNRESIPYMNLYLYKNDVIKKMNKHISPYMKHFIKEEDIINQIYFYYKHRLALLIPTTSRKRQYNNPEDTDLFKILIPSLIKTSKNTELTLFIGYDDGDKYYDNKDNLDNCKDYFKNMTKDIKFDIHFYKFYNINGNVTKVWNKLFKIAYFKGYDHFFQSGDDINMLTDNSLELLIKSLKLGYHLVGPRDCGQHRLLTQTLVTRKHMQIFGYYFNPSIKNWWCDDWINCIYFNMRLAKRDESIKIINSGGDPRYTIYTQGHNNFYNSINHSIDKIVKWLKLYKNYD